MSGVEGAEYALDESFSVFKSLFKFLNGRATDSLQKHELVMYCSDVGSFESLALQLI